MQIKLVQVKYKSKIDLVSITENESMLQHKPQIFQGQYAFCSNRRNSNTSDLNPFAESIQRENVEDLPQMHRKTSLQYLQAKHISGKKMFKQAQFSNVNKICVLCTVTKLSVYVQSWAVNQLDKRRKSGTK